MNSLQKQIKIQIVKSLLNKIKKAPDTSVNLFNSGIVINSKALQIKALEKLLKIIEKQN